jgi:hypothetical protein
VDGPQEVAEVVGRVGGERLEVGQRAVAVEHGGEQAVAPVEEAVQGGQGAVGRRGDGVQSGGAEALLGDERRGGRDRALAGGRTAARVDARAAHGVVERGPGAAEPPQQRAARHPRRGGDRRERDVRDVAVTGARNRQRRCHQFPLHLTHNTCWCLMMFRMRG